MPWLGASDNRTLRGMAAANTLPGKWRRTSSATWAEKFVRLCAELSGAKEQADGFLKDAAATADRKSAAIVAAAKEQAQRIVADAEADAALAKEKAQADMKREIVDVCAGMAGALLRWEVCVVDKEGLADAFIDSFD